MAAIFYQWIDLLWLPVGMVAVHKGQRLKTALFMIVCILTLRAQVELMESIDGVHGFTGFWSWDAYQRGLLVYAIVFALFLLLAYFSPNTRGIVFFAATLTIYIASFCISMLLMVI